MENITKTRNKMLFAVVASAMMLMIGFAAIVSDDSSADENYVSNGTFTVNVRTSVNTSWVTDTVAAYDGALALSRALALHNTSNDVDTTMYSYPTQYVAIDYQYGAFTTIGGIVDTATASWHTYFYHVSNGWTLATDTLGWYKPFGDYDIAHRTANIAVIYGTDSDVASIMNSTATQPASTSSVVPLSDIEGNPNFMVSFYIKVNASAYTAITDEGRDINVGSSGITKQQVLDGVYVYGYGSDLYLALKDVFGTLVQGQEVVPCYNNGSYDTVYGWLYSFLSVSSIWMGKGPDNVKYTDDDIWAWWQEYYTYSVDSVTGNVTGTTSDFAIGLLSPLQDAPLTHPTFALYFAAGSM